jgi:hypothetical protein
VFEVSSRACVKSKEGNELILCRNRDSNTLETEHIKEPHHAEAY